MSEGKPTIQTMQISDVKRQLSNVVNAVYRREICVLVEKAGVPAAALISVTDLERLVQWERERDERFAVIDQMREAFRDVPPEEIERNVVGIIREMREADEAAITAQESTAVARRRA
jgi:prevent-host-death family protein